MRVIKKQYFIVFWAIVLILSAIFFRYDLDISKSVFNRTSTFGRIFEVIGEYPNSFALIIGASWIFGATKKTRKLVSIQSLVLFLISGVGWGGLTLFSWEHYHIDDVEITFKVLFICGIISVIGDALVLYLFTTFNDKILKKYVEFALLAVLTAILNLMLVNIIKVFWGRMRFRDMGLNYDLFSRWLFPQGLTGNKSFPSGHTANATTIIVLLPATKIIDKKKKLLKAFLYILIFAWPITVAISRVIVGAHFASDVLFGMASTVTIFYFLSNKMLKQETHVLKN